MFTNLTNVPLSLAVWLANDDYDHNTDPNYISATSLLKPIKSIVLERSLKIDTIPDVAAQIASSMGTAIHDSIENAWLSDKLAATLRSLNMPAAIVKRIVVNPSDDGTLDPDAIVVRMEQRSAKAVGKYLVAGKYDFVIQGQLEDFKSTKVFSYIKQGNAKQYIQQGSIYRWLNQDTITEPTIQINYIFTDWAPMKALQDKSYPKTGIVSQQYPLMTIDQTQQFVANTLAQIDKYTGLPQDQMPACTLEELWRDEPVFKYFKNPAKRARSTKNFTTSAEAYQRLHADNSVGVVVEVPGLVRRCNYCNARAVCQQAEELTLAGYLK